MNLQNPIVFCDIPERLSRSRNYQVTPDLPVDRSFFGLEDEDCLFHDRDDSGIYPLGFI